MLRRRFIASFIAMTCGLSLVCIAKQASALFVVNQPWALPAQRTQTTEVYMNLTSTDGATLVGVQSASAERLTIRAPGKTGGEVARLALPPGNVIALAPGAYRIVLHRLLQTLRLGDRLQLRLTIETADGSQQDIGVDAEVRRHAPLDDELHAHKHGH